MTEEELKQIVAAIGHQTPKVTQTFNFNAPIGQQIAHVDRIEAHFDKGMGMNIGHVGDTSYREAETDTADDNTVVNPLTPTRSDAFARLLALMDRAPWQAPVSAEEIRHFLLTVFGVEGGTPLTSIEDQKLSARLWRLMEQGRGNRVEIMAMNLAGYFVSRCMLTKGSPAIAKAMFGSNKGYTNIDKGNPDCQSLSQGFSEVVPLLDRWINEMMK